jgi:hypothetical protein
MDTRHLRASHHLLVIEVRIKEADIVGYGTGKQLILLHDGSDLLAINPHTHGLQGDTIDDDLTARWIQQPEHDFQESRLSAA